MKTPELKPCPFCGGKPMVMGYQYTSDGEEKILIGCTTCAARLETVERFLMIERVNKYGQKDIVNSGIVISPGAAEQWNRRVTDKGDSQT